MSELFSVIVANYNNGKYLPQLVHSMFNQTYRNWELLIADDFSTDNSIEIINKYSKDDSRIKLFKHNTNLGAGATFKTAMEHSKGSIIGMLGADDALLPEALEKMIQAHSKYPLSSLINSQAFDCDADLNPYQLCSISGKQPKNISFIQEVFVGNFVTFKRSAYIKTNGFEGAFQRAVDRDIFLKLEEVGTIEFVETPLYLYRRHGTGISQGGNGIKAANYELLAKINAYKRRKEKGFVPNISNKEYEKLAITYFSRKANNLRNQKNFLEAFKTHLYCLNISKTYLFKRTFWSIFFYNIKAMIIKT